LWDANSGELLHNFGANADSFGRSQIFSPDGNFVAVGSEGHLARLRDIRTGAIRLEIPCSPTSYQCFLSPDGRTLAVPASDGGITLFDTVAGNQQLRVQTDFRSPSRAFFTGDSCGIVVVSSGGVIRVYDAANGSLRQELDTKPLVVYSIAFDAKKLILALSTHRGIEIWDIQNSRLLRTLRAEGGTVSSMAFSSGGQYLVTGATDLMASVWEVPTGRLLHVLELPAPSKWELFRMSHLAGPKDADPQVVGGAGERSALEITG
jgi:WD40 repeat protein